MEEQKSSERHFAVHWYIHVTRAEGGVIRCRAVAASPTSLLFLAPVRYRYGDTLHMVIYLSPQQTVYCSGRIVNNKSPYRVEFIRFADEDRLIYNDELLKMLRALRQRAEWEPLYSTPDSEALRRSP